MPCISPVRSLWHHLRKILGAIEPIQSKSTPGLHPGNGRKRGLVPAALVLGVIGVCFNSQSAATPPVAANSERPMVLSLSGKVEILRAGLQGWQLAKTNQVLNPGDSVRTAENSRAAVRLMDRSVLRLPDRTVIVIESATGAKGKSGVKLDAGGIYLNSRQGADEIRLRTPLVSCGIRGTEFHVEVGVDGRTVLSLFEGEVDLENEFGKLELKNGEAGTVDPSRAPVKTPLINAVNIIQWCLYYPGVIDTRELEFTADERATLATSLAAYRDGDLLQALAKFPTDIVPTSESVRVYRAALLLSVGNVQEAEALLKTLSLPGPQSKNRNGMETALRGLIAAVKFQSGDIAKDPATATEWLSRSYYLQSVSKLRESLDAARSATVRSPQFGFAWARVAELEFSFGRISEAQRALDQALALSPRNAQAVALQGFLACARNRFREASDWFEKAMAIDGALGNAWLGRGLVRIHQGDAELGRQDLQIAVALEPHRALLRSYLGKAFGNVGDSRVEGLELNRAKALDANDPTPWLYSALQKVQENRINEAIADLEKSEELNDNRRLYRSRLLLDQDRAVRGASLARIYQRAGMDEVSVFEAARAVVSDYGNPSAHLFLAESYDALRDPSRFNLRYETVWFNELLLANLLAPVGAGPLSQHVTQQEYSRLFEADRIGFSSDLVVRSDGRVREIASQFGTFGGSSYALDVEYEHHDGIRPNNELSRLEWYSKIKQHLTPQDSLFFLAKYQDYHSGDNFQYTDPTHPRLNFSFDDLQDPIVIGAYHHEWQPGFHTLVLAGRLIDENRFTDRNASQTILTKSFNGQVIGLNSTGFDVDYRSQFEIYTAELENIFQDDHQTAVFGVRYQTGTFRTDDRLTLSSANPGLANLFTTPPAAGSDLDDFERASAYGYYTREVVHDLFLTAGLAYEDLTYPKNYRHPPVAAGTSRRARVDPKAALVWTPTRAVTLRASYARSLGGVSFDESFRLEPTQLAGFSQAFRTVIPESVVGSVSAPAFETWSGALDANLSSRTYASIQGELIQSAVDRSVGVFDFNNSRVPIVPSSTSEQLDFEERSLTITLNQLLSQTWSLGARHRLSRAELRSLLAAVPRAVNAQADRTESGVLHETALFVLYNHRSGFYSRAEWQWYRQDNSGYAPASPENAGEDFHQFNWFWGYRFARQRAEVAAGVMNLADQDYRLNPLTVYQDLPRERVFMARLRLNF